MQLASENGDSEIGGMDNDMSEASGLESETQSRNNNRNKVQKKTPSRGKEKAVPRNNQSVQVNKKGISYLITKSNIL